MGTGAVGGNMEETVKPGVAGDSLGELSFLS